VKTAKGGIVRILVTGGAGFIGSRLVRKLAEKGHLVAVVDDFSTGKSERLADLEGRQVNTAVLDIVNAAQLEELVSLLRIEVIFHLAAVSDVQTCEEKCARAVAVNVMGTAAVFRAAHRVSSVQRIIFSSSAAIYGDLEPPVGGHTEAAQRGRPAGVYGWTKAWDEYLLIPERLKCSTAVLRFGNVYGAHDAAGVIPAFFEAAEAGGPLVIYGDGNQTRDFVHVDDIVAALYRCAICPPSRLPSTWNVAGGRPTSINELADWFVREYPGLEVRHEPLRDGDIQESVLNPELIAQELRVRAQIDLADGLSRMKEELDRERCCQA
jgi:UDP-glucose 4-epimerase